MENGTWADGFFNNPCNLYVDCVFFYQRCLNLKSKSIPRMEVGDALGDGHLDGTTPRLKQLVFLVGKFIKESLVMGLKSSHADEGFNNLHHQNDPSGFHRPKK